MSKYYLVEMPDDFKSDNRTRYACDWCINRAGCNANVFYCPLANAKKAVEVKGGISRAIATQFDKEIKLYAVEEHK